jgi:hypothetical protein
LSVVVNGQSSTPSKRAPYAGQTYRGTVHIALGVHRGHGVVRGAFSTMRRRPLRSVHARVGRSLLGLGLY